MQIIDRLLDPYEYDLLKKVFLQDHDFPWYWRDSVLLEGDDDYQLLHWLYKDGAPRSDQFDNIVPSLFFFLLLD